MFYDLFIDLCKEKGVSPSKAAESIELNRTAVVKWKKGAVPSGVTLKKLADYFNVSVDYLMRESMSDNPKNTERIKDSELSGVYLSLARDAQENGLDPDDIRLAIEMVKKLKKK